jgi:mannose-6-phosphate isomerase-like protein (cupin superfamily)
MRIATIRTFVALFTLALAGSFLNQAAAQTQHMPRGTATDITKADVDATLAKTASAKVSDQAIRVVSINDEYYVGVGVVHRSKVDSTAPGNAIEHSQITEVYHFISGDATFVTGGTIENAKESSPESAVVKVLNGPSTSGGKIEGGVSRKVGPGDVVIIPPNTPHWFGEIRSAEVVYLVVRMDPHKVLPAGYGAK